MYATRDSVSFVFFKKYRIAVWLVCLMGCLQGMQGYAATRTSTAAGGNWGTTTTWVGGIIPLATDNVIIATTGLGKVTVNSIARTCTGVTISAGATLECTTIALTVNGPWVNNGSFTKGTATVTFGTANAAISGGASITAFNNLALTSGASLAISDTVTVSGNFTIPVAAAVTRVLIASTGSLAVTGAVTMARPNAGFTSTISVGDGSFSAGSLTMSATTATRNDSLTIGNGSATIAGNITHGTTGCVFRFYGSGSLAIGGTLSGTTVGFTAGAGTVNFNGAAAQTAWAVTYNDLTLSGAGVKTVTGATVNGTLSRQGTSTVTGTPTYGASAALEYKGDIAQTTGTEFPATWAGAGGILIDNVNGVKMNAAKNIGTRQLQIGSQVASSLFSDGGFQLTATGTINLVSGIFQLGSATVATGYPAFGTNSFAAGTTVEYAAGVAQTVSVTPTYKNLSFSGNGNKTVAAGTVSVSGNWDITGGTALLSVNNAGANIAGNITGTGAVTMGSDTISLQGGWTNSGTFTPGTGTVNYNLASGGQTVGAMTYYTLAMGNTSGVQTASGNITATNLTSVAGSSLDMGINTLAVTNTATGHAGRLLTQNTSATPISVAKTWGGTVLYNSASPQTIVHGDYTDLDGSGGARTLSALGIIGIAGLFTPGAGAYTVTGSTVNFNGSGTQDIPAFTFGNLVISNGGTKRILGNIVVGCSSVSMQGSASLQINASNAGKLNIVP
ncbi:beta strand repeat-containing protein [Sediminibacterium soli]|uniref:beta strand repeat-containing protein n=1 Tax=Sediminibacterium soli TaxID=2698829 RepID=UPI001379F1DE|nr:hypothetical protein [Sediminibacterium soli]NCI46657.1 hypothetical protein [Sediminibacterium soli]